jgi:hypothetical protein
MSAVAVAVGVGVAGVAAAGASIYAANKQSDATKDANRANLKATKKFQEAARKEADLGFKETNELFDKYLPAQKDLTKEFQTQVDKQVAGYDEGITSIVNDYNKSVAALTGKIDANASAFALRSEDIATRSADQTFQYNQSKLSDFTKFATDLSNINQTIRLGMIEAANPAWQSQKAQAALTNSQMMAGILPAEIAAQAARAGAQGSLASGVLGGDLSRNRVARDFVMTSFDLMKKGQGQALEWQKNIYDQEVSGLQVGVGDVMNTQGLNTQQVLQTNQQNNLALLDAQNRGAEFQMTGLNNSLGQRSSAQMNMLSTKNAALGQYYQTESEALRDYTSGKVGAVTDRTNVRLGLEAQGLSNSYANANRTLQSELASAQLYGNAISQVGGALGGAIGGGAFGGGMAAMGGGGYSAFAGLIGTTSPGGAANPYAQTRRAIPV